VDLKHDDRDDELDKQLAALFRSTAEPMPSARFAARTMKAVKRAPLPPGRRPLRSPFAGIVGWAALVAGVAMSAVAIAANTPVVMAAFAALLSGGIAVGVWVVQSAVAGLALSDLFATTGFAVSRVVATREGSTALLLITAIGASALLALQRLLVSERAEGGISQWQEL
jgi:hypothetical protein